LNSRAAETENEKSSLS